MKTKLQILSEVSKQVSEASCWLLAPKQQETFIMIEPTSAQNHPWAIARTFVNKKSHIVARFANRQDAEDYLRFLRRTIPNGTFEIIFEPPDDVNDVEE